MKKHALIKLKKNRSCEITKIFLPKNSVLYADHVIKDVWMINNNNIRLSVIEYEDFEFV
jgi:hypothetical protein